MNSELKKLKERFEIEIWLYIDGTMPEKERAFWDEQLSKYADLKNYYDEIINSLELYKSNSSEELSAEEFDKMLTATDKSTSLIDYVNSFFEMLFSNNLSATKAVVAAALSVIALVALLTSEKPNAVKNISNDILSWQGESISKEMNEVDESIETLSIIEWEKYQLIQANYDEWEQSYFLLNQEIEQMKKDLGDTSL
jgi:hypothetical protein